MVPAVGADNRAGAGYTVPLMGQLPDLDAAALFVKVIDAGSFRGAARALGVPKSTVSRRIAALEERLGARLLQRTTRRLGLTDAGVAYHRQAAQAISVLDDAERAVSALQEAPRGPLRVTAPVLFGVLFLPDLVAEFLDRYPEVQLSLDLTDRNVDLVEEGYDVAIRAGALADSSFVAHKLGGTPFQLFASPAYLRARGTPTRVEDLAEHDCLVLGTQTQAVWPFRGARRAHQVAVRGRLAANNFLLLRDAAIAGLGICRIPGFLAIEAVRRGRLVTVLDGEQQDPTPMSVLYPSARHVSPKVRAFVGFLRARLGGRPFLTSSELSRPRPRRGGRR